MNRDHFSDQKNADAVVGKTVLGRLSAPSDIASAVAFLVGPDAAWVTGQIIEASGGFGLSH